MRAAYLLAVLAACFSPNPPEGLPCSPGAQCPPGQECIAGFCNGTEPQPDGGGDPECLSWPSQIVDTCNLPRATNTVVITGIQTLDTSEGVLSGIGDDEVTIRPGTLGAIAVVIMVVGRLEVAATGELRIRGNKPAVIAAWDGVDVAGQIDASGGAGADGLGCGIPAIPLGVQMGGVGGSRGAVGGDGGPNSSGDLVRAAPYTGLDRLDGGCSGTSGVSGQTGTAGGPGGNAGGALALLTRDVLLVSGGVSANGDGGRGGGSGAGSDSSGGGGGGAGGHLILEAALLDLNNATIVANGGGGGAGGGNNFDGDNGSPGGPTTDGASGGVSPNESNDGGNGGAAFSCRGENGGAGSTMSAQELGGGGGGGACGVIEVSGVVAETPAIISPVPRFF